MNSYSNEIQTILSAIDRCKNRLTIKYLLQRMTLGLLPGVVLALIFQILSFLIPFYYANLCSLLAILVFVCGTFLYHFTHPISRKKVALYMDSFGLDEHIITAYENREQEGVFLDYQREQTLRLLKEKEESITVSYLPNIRYFATLCTLLLVTTVMILLPSDMKRKAMENHEIMQVVKEKEKEIKEKLDEISTIDPTTLTDEEKKALEDFKNALSSSYNEYQQVHSADDLKNAGDRLDYKLSEFQQSIGNPMANAGNNTHGTPNANSNGNPNSNPGGNSDPSTGASQGGNSGSPDGNNGNQNGNNPQGDGSGNGGDSGNSQGGQGDNTGGSDANASGNGQGDNANGNTEGAGNGAGNDGNGEGDGNGGNGSGGNGSGRGTGSASNSRDYVSVPNAIGDDESIHGNGQTSDNDSYYLGQNGLNWEGNHTPYEEVIGDYQQKAYEGLTTGRYPSGMEHVIKDYFSSFN